jgi:hypothetical protein
MSGQASSRLIGVPGAGMLLLAMCLPAHADWEFSVFTAQSPGPAGMDRAFECEVQRLMDKHADQLQGVDAVVTRFGNIIVITGQARDAGDRTRVDKLVLDVAGITRAEAGGPAVVPASTLACEGKSLPANARRKSIIKPDRDCSSLRADADMQGPATGQLFNHLAVASPDPAKQLASAELLAAQARMSLLGAGVINAMDRRVIRLVAQQDVIYVLGNLDAALQAGVRTVLMQLAGVGEVRFYAD